jgi:hypothetical protein
VSASPIETSRLLGEGRSKLTGLVKVRSQIAVWSLLFLGVISAQSQPVGQTSGAETNGFSRLVDEARIAWEKNDFDKALPLYEEVMRTAGPSLGSDTLLS